MVKTYNVICPECNESFPIQLPLRRRAGMVKKCMMCDVELLFLRTNPNKIVNFKKYIWGEEE